MQQVLQIWSGLSPKRRIVMGLATLAMFVTVLGIGRLATQPSLTLLYAGLEAGAAGEVVSALEQRGAAYQIRGDSIFVDGAVRDELRMTLASEGLPSNPVRGYELLDEMTGFGTTSQMFDSAAWRAKEGELARTIVSSPTIAMARVHIANAGTKPFQRDLEPTASVMLTPAGSGLSAAQARAVRYLVASAVAGLAPENVSVIDANGGVILAGDGDGARETGEAGRAAELKRNVERLLEARVGYGRAVVEIAVETVTQREEINERRIDPESRIAISEDVSQSSSNARDAGGGDVTVASNLPDGDAAGGGDGSSSTDTETRERTNYEVSETVRQVVKSPGAVDRISTAVLIDGIRGTGADGAPTWTPRPEPEMAALRELVAAAVGFDEARGDILSIQSMEFEPLPLDGSDPVARRLFGPIDAMRLVQLGVLALVALILGLFVVRPVLRQQAALPAPEGAPAAAAAAAPLTGEIDPQDTPGTFMPPALADARATPGSPAASGESPAERLRQLIDERQEESLQILRSWMEDEEETA